MEGRSRKADGEGSRRFDADTIEREMRERIRHTIELIVEEELKAVLGARVSERVGEERNGYRHGHRERTLTTRLGVTTIAMPRARLNGAQGSSAEWRSETVRRYQRLTARVDEAILGVYLSGANRRRIKGALAPLLRGGPLSKDAVSRLIGRLKEEFERWRERNLATEQVRYLLLDGWYPKVRIGWHRVRVPVRVTLGVCADGRRIVLDLRLVGEETAAGWQAVVAWLVKRQVGVPALAIIDGNPGLDQALRAEWPQLPIQRCTAHKLRNLQAKVPAALREEVAEDYHRMIYATTAAAVTSALLLLGLGLGLALYAGYPLRFSAAFRQSRRRFAPFLEHPPASCQPGPPLRGPRTTRAWPKDQPN